MSRFILSAENWLDGGEENALQEKDEEDEREYEPWILAMPEKSGIFHVVSIS